MARTRRKNRWVGRNRWGGRVLRLNRSILEYPGGRLSTLLDRGEEEEEEVTQEEEEVAEVGVRRRIGE